MTLSTAVSIGRRNRSRYDRFWATINWQIPDALLSQIWQSDRGNIRARRIRLGKGPPRWRVRRDQGNPVFQAAIRLELHKANRFVSPKPAVSLRLLKGSTMSIPAEIFLERIKQSDEGITSFSLEIRLLGVTKRNITASIESDPGFENPKLTSVVDQVCLLDLDRHLLLMATFTKMARYHGEGPTGRTIQWARWVLPNLKAWLRVALYQQNAGRIARTIERLVAGASLPDVKEFTESLED